MRFSSTASLVFEFFLVTSAVFAQSDRGTITGTVTDPTKASVAAAAVTAKNSDSGALYRTVTTSTGAFTLPELPAGPYDVTVVAAGFKNYTQQGVTVQVAETNRLDVALQIGSASESVTVTSDASLLKSENAELSTTVNGDRINALPLNFGGGGGSVGAVRDPLAFIILSPGVSGTGSGGSVNGLPGSTYRVFFEGQDTTSGNANARANETQGSVEMIEEFTLQTSNYSAEFGQVEGGLVNFTSRSGTNQFHGSAYEYFVNEDLDAYRPFTYVNPTSRKNDWGFTVGGPIWIPKVYNGHNKSFFFFNLEKFDNKGSSNGTFGAVPTAAERSGNFSAILTNRILGTDILGRPIMENSIYDPTTARTVNGQVVTDPFPNNVIPQSRLDPVALKIQALIPAPTNAGLVNNWNYNALSSKHQIIPGLKLDQLLTSNARLSFYWSEEKTHQYASADGLPVPLTAVRDQAIYSDTTRLNYDHTLSPRFILHAGAGYVRYLNPDSSPASVLGNYDAVAGVGFVGGAVAGFPRINGLNAAAGGVVNITNGFGPTNANKYYNDKLTSVLSATYVRGNHTFKTGGEFRIDMWTDRNSRGATGVLNVNGNETGLPYLQSTTVGGGNIGFPYASFLLGLIDNATINPPQDPQLRKHAWGLYLQDNWKVTRKLTLDYGLRYDLEGEGHEIHYRTSMFGPTIPNPTAGGRLGALVYEGYGAGRCNCQFTTTYPYAVGPRFGLAFQLDPKTVLRAAAGIIYAAPPPFNYITNSAILGVGYNQLTFSNPSFGQPGVILSQGLKYNPADLHTATLNPGLVPNPGQLNSPAYYIDRNGGRPPRIYQWNMGIQREIYKDLIVEASYVGNRGIWLPNSSLENLNAINPATLTSLGLNLNSAADRQLLNSPLNSTLAQSRGFTAPYAGFPLTATVAQSLRPYPQFGGVTVDWSPLGDSWYNSMQSKVTKRYSHGLSLTSAFTWSKAELSPGGTVNNVFNRGNQKSIASYDQPFLWNTGFNYDVPKFGHNRYLNLAANGWTIGGIFQYGSGLPIAAPSSNNNLNSLIFQSTLMNRVRGVPLYTKDLNCHCVDPNKDFVLNPAAWTDAPAGQFGTAAPYYSDYRYQRRPNEQLSLGRMFRIREKMSLSVRAEFFNVFNRTQLGNPSSTNAASTQVVTNGVATSGFGYISPSAIYSQPRNGQLVARFQW